MDFNSEVFETDDRDYGICCLSSTIADTLDLAVRRPATSTVHVRPLERLSGRWTFRSMPQDVNLVAYGKQFSGEWPSFRGDMERDAVANATPPSALTKDSAHEETEDCGIWLSGADGKISSASSHPNKTFARQCVAYVFSWDFCRTVCLFFLSIVIFRKRK